VIPSGTSRGKSTFTLPLLRTSVFENRHCSPEIASLNKELREGNLVGVREDAEEGVGDGVSL
jgi:hypothetical protein